MNRSAKSGEAHGSAPVTVRLLSTTDIHGYLLGHDYFADRQDPRVGLTRTATLISEARSEARNSLLFDSGDFLQGNAITDVAAQSSAGDLHPAISAMNLLGYDAAVLGNHDFNYGLTLLNRAQTGARFPILCANIQAEGLNTPGAVLLDRKVVDDTGAARRLRIGVFGITPPQTISWDRHVLPEGTTAQDMIASARTQIATLRAQGADVVVGLCHTGVGSAQSFTDPEHVATSVAELPGIDAVLAGHSHKLYASPPEGRRPGAPVVLAGSWGGWLGVVDLELRQEGEGWRSVVRNCGLRPVMTETGPVPEDPALAAHLAPVHAATRAHILRPIGRTRSALHSYFALAAPSRTEQLVAEAKLGYLRRKLAGTSDADLPLLAATAPFKAGAPGRDDYYTDIPKGAITLRSIADLYMYPNAFCAVRATGADLRLWLEQSAAQFHRIAPGASDAILLDPAFPSHSFDILRGLTYAFDLSQPARFSPDGRVVDPGARRVRDLRHAGRAVQDSDRFIVATNAYRAGGGGGFPIWSRDRVAVETTDRVQDILGHHAAEHGVGDKPGTRVFRFQPLDGATALLLTGSGAAAHTGEAAALGLTPAGTAADGNLRFRLQL